MAARPDYAEKFESFMGRALYEKLRTDQQEFVRAIAFEHRFTFQEFREVVEVIRDLTMWGEGDLERWWREEESQNKLKGLQLKRYLFRKLRAYIGRIRAAPKTYPTGGLSKPAQRVKRPVRAETSEKRIHGMCPVASGKTVCCNLHTIDAVENCPLGCSYCTIQTFYQEEYVFDSEFVQKLNAIELAPGRFYHFCTGQSSDSLAWGNRNGNLDALCRFAADHPNILLEFKTKSSRIGYFLQAETPRNIVCSWSLNTPVVIENEEHFTATLDERVRSARRVADRGVRVAFHFHPLILYKKWADDYRRVASRLTELFEPEEVLFVSFGTVTLIKPVIQKIRNLGHATKILQMELVPDPHGKWTYPDDVKVMMFRLLRESLSAWHDRVFMYLCMEKASVWQRTFGWVYPDNEEFELDFGRKTVWKVAPSLAHSDSAL